MSLQPGRPVKPGVPSHDADPGTTPDDETLNPARSPTGGPDVGDLSDHEKPWDRSEELEALEARVDRPGAEITAVEASRERRDGEHRGDKLNYIQIADRKLERIESEANAALEQLAAPEHEYNAQVLKLAEDADARVREVQDLAEAALRTQLARIRAETEQRLRAAEVEPHTERRSGEAAPPT